VKQHDTADREWLTDAERQAKLAAQLADIESGLHPERYVGWRYWTAECVESGLRALCASEAPFTRVVYPKEQHVA